MSSETRFELLERVGAGSFATVYRARDTELGREVAVKQIHEQFMDMPEQMERYWQEAQLLAQLQHPNIVTFFDIDRVRGWLIMELMQGNVSDRITTGPLDLKSVRTTLAHCLRAMRYLHEQGIVHGDIKPGNMMIDSRKRIKIGDFGLARRVADEDGSLLKGSTKYMAPEVVSEEFGEVGPQSDLYSLGFSAYELMCGPNFEQLFPGLGAFGRDKQIAWMMWHAAADRKLPAVNRVLEGVPDDLAHVVQKLVDKNPANRYQSAEEALSDLQVDLKVINKGGGPVDEEPESDNRRKIAIAAFCASLILSLAILFVPSGNPESEEVATSTEPVAGVVGHVDADAGFFSVTDAEGVPQEVRFGKAPKILLNGQTYITARELESEDRVSIVRETDDNGVTRLLIDVSRPDESVGYITQIQPQLEKFTIQITEGSRRSELQVRVNETTSILVNDKRALIGELKTDDQITVWHLPDEDLPGARRATEIVALQKRPIDGIVRDVSDKELTVETQLAGNSKLIKLPVAAECEVTVNGKKIVEGRLLKPVDLKPGDRVDVTHHTEIVVVHAVRQSLHSGLLLEVRADDSTLVVSEGEDERRIFVAAKECSVSINGKPAELADLRRSDRLEVSYDSADLQNEASFITALRSPNENRYAILIGIQNYDDRTLSKLSSTAADAKFLHETLLSRYGCAPDRTLLLVDETRVRIEQAVPDWLRKTNENSEVIIFFSGHAYLNEEGEPYLAAKDFELSRTSESGIALTWLRDQLEGCLAVEKLLLIDSSRPGEGSDLEQQQSPSALLKAVQPEKEPAVFRTTWAISACGQDQFGLDLADGTYGLFASVLAKAYSGKGDVNEDVHLEPTELFDYLRNEMASVEIDKLKQTPVLFRPDATPPAMDRLSPEAKEAIRTLIANHWTARRRLPATAEVEFLAASRLAEDEPDARLTWAILHLKSRGDREAAKYFEQVRLSHPQIPVSYEGLAWINCYAARHSDGIPALTAMFEKLLAENPDMPIVDPYTRRVLGYAGRLREFAATIADEARRPDASDLAALDEAVAAIGDEAVAVFESGREGVRKKLTDYDDQIEKEAGSMKGKLLELERKRLTSYVEFAFDEARRFVTDRLDQNDPLR